MLTWLAPRLYRLLEFTVVLWIVHLNTLLNNGFPTFTPTAVPKRSHFKPLRSSQIYVCIHPFLLCVNIYPMLVSILLGKYLLRANFQCKIPRNTLQNLISLIRGGLHRAKGCVAVALGTGSPLVLDILLLSPVPLKSEFFSALSFLDT